MSLDKKTDEFRVVKFRLFGLPLWVSAVQRKYLVQDGVSYVPANFGPPTNEEDAFVGVIDGLPHFQPMRAVWRDLPEVEEAKR